MQLSILVRKEAWKNTPEEEIGIFRIFSQLPLSVKSVEVARTCVQLLKGIKLPVEQLGGIEQNTTLFCN